MSRDNDPDSNTFNLERTSDSASTPTSWGRHSSGAHSVGTATKTHSPSGEDQDSGGIIPKIVVNACGMFDPKASIVHSKAIQ
jgi:hypothetical protein